MLSIKSDMSDKTILFGWSKSDITLMLCSEDGEMEISQKVHHESKLSNFKVAIKPSAGLINKGEGVLSQLSIHIDYVDLRCNFSAISVFEFDYHHFLRREEKKVQRQVFYLGMQKSERYLPFFSMLTDSYETDNSIAKFTKPPAGSVSFRFEGYIVGIVQDIFITPSLEPSPIFNHRQSSCAYDAASSKMVYYIKGGYAGTYNGDSLVSFFPEISNQIAFYYIDMGG
jgi:hypothetical protein